jgi:AcrR family transcriptional regulator
MDARIPELGRRERSKLDKRRRIGEAARTVFTEFGYERANMREIAKRAGVATGTLFLYAPDKRNLLLWILTDDLEGVSAESFASLRRDPSKTALIDQLMHVFEARYRYWGADPDLSLHALQELIVSREFMATPGTHLADYMARRVQLFERITALVRAQQERGAVDPTIDPELLARLALGIYNAAMRTWLRTAKADLPAGLEELRNLLQLAINGTAKTSAPDVAETSD